MPQIPLGNAAYKRDVGFQTEVLLENLVMEKDDSGASPDGFMRIQRPGLTANYTINSPVRGLYQQQGIFDGDVFSVGGSNFYRDQTLVSAITGTGIASMASSIDRIGVVLNPNFYTYDGTLDQVTVPDDREAIDLEQLNSYLIVLTPTGRFYWLVPGEAAIDPLDFANAESSPDGGVAVKRLVDELFFFNTTTVEVWQTTGDLNAPFQRAAGRIYDKGCLNKDTVQRFDNSIIWVGDDLSVYRASQVPQDIGSPFLSERLRKRTGDPTAIVLKFDDHEVYVLRIPGQGSFAFDALTQTWSDWKTYGMTEWTPHVAVGEVDLVGDSATGKIWRFDPENGTDDGLPIVRKVTGTISIPSRPVASSNFTVGVGASDDTTAYIRWKDGRDEWPAYYEDIEVRAPYDIVNIYRTGQMREPFRSWEVMFDGPERVRISAALFAEAWA